MTCEVKKCRPVAKATVRIENRIRIGPLTFIEKLKACTNCALEYQQRSRPNSDIDLHPIFQR